MRVHSKSIVKTSKINYAMSRHISEKKDSITYPGEKIAGWAPESYQPITLMDPMECIHIVLYRLGINIDELGEIWSIQGNTIRQWQFKGAFPPKYYKILALLAMKVNVKFDLEGYLALIFDLEHLYDDDDSEELIASDSDSEDEDEDEDDE